MIDRDSLEERLIAEFDGQLGECSLSRDGDWFVAACKTGQQNGVVVGTYFGRPPADHTV